MPNKLTMLRRITSDGRWLPEIDGLRFMAITSVFLYHFTLEVINKSGHLISIQSRYDLPLRFIMNGGRGVPLFFVISGFILARPFASHHLLSTRPVDLGAYFMRRVTRLEPPYLLCLLLCTFATAVYYHPPFHELLPHMLASAFYLHGIAYRQMSSINPVLWSLEIEIQFYLLVPLLAQIFRIKSKAARRISLLAMIATAAILQAVFIPSSPVRLTPFQLTILAYLQYFLAGLLLADIYLVEGSLPYSRNRGWDVVSLAGWSSLFYIVQDSIWVQAILPFLIMLLYIAAFRGVAFRAFFRNQWIATIGGMCYTIYLVHSYSMAILFKRTRHLVVFHDLLANLAVQLVIMLPIIAVVCLIFYTLIERPCMDPKWPRKLIAYLSGHRTALKPAAS